MSPVLWFYLYLRYTSLLHSVFSCAFRSASSQVMFMSSSSCCVICLIHVSFGLPLGALHDVLAYSIALFAGVFEGNLIAWPNHVIRSFLIRLLHGCILDFLYTSSFRIFCGQRIFKTLDLISRLWNASIFSLYHDMYCIMKNVYTIWMFGTHIWA